MKLNEEEKKDIKNAKKELEYFNIVVEEIGGNSWDKCLQILKNRGVEIGKDTYDEDNERKQIDCFGTFVAFTLQQVGGKVEIGYSWTLGDIRYFELSLNEKGKAVLIC